MSILRSLQAKVLLAAIIPGSIILIIVAVIALFQYGATVLKIVEERDSKLAMLSAYQLSDGLVRHTRVLETIANEGDSPVLDTVATRLSIASARGQLRQFDGGVTLYDQGGRPTWSTLGPNASQLPMHPEIDSVRASTMPVYSDVFSGSGTDQTSVRFSVPVLDVDQKFMGVVSGTASLDGALMMSVIKDSLTLSSDAESLTYVVDGGGHSIFHSRPELIGQDFTEYPPVAEVIKGTSGANLSTSPSGEGVISGFAPVPGTDWGVVTQQLRSEVEQPILVSSLTVLGLLLLGALLSIGGIWLSIGRALRPIRELNAGAQRIASGDFDYTIQSQTGDEVQQLAHQFNLMAQALKAYYAELEERVELRTSELADSEERVRAAAEESAVMAEIGRIVGSSLDMSLVYDRFASQTRRLISADAIAIMTVHPDEDNFNISYLDGMSLRERRAGKTYPLRGTVTAKTYHTGRPVLYQPTKEELLPRDFPGLLPMWNVGLRSFLAVPLISNNEAIGVLWLGSRTETAFGDREIEAAERVSAQIAGAVANSQLYEQIQQFFAQERRRADQFRTIAEVGRQLTSIRDPYELLASVGEIGTTELGYETTTIGVIEEDVLVFPPEANPHLSFPIRRALKGERGPEGVTGLVAATGKPIIVPDVLDEPRYMSVIDGPPARSSATVQVSAGGNALGVLHSQNRNPDAFDQADQVVLQALAQEIGIALENARIFESERRRNEQLAAINAVALNVSAVLTLSELLPHVVQLVRETFGYHTVGVYLKDESEDTVVLQAVNSGSEFVPPRGLRMKVGGEGIIGHVTGTGLPWITGDVENDPFFTDLGLKQLEIRSELVMPIKQGDALVGALDLYSAESDAFDDADMLIAQTLANQLAVAIENARILDETRDMAVLEERNRMAREIHDTLAQGFTSIVIQLEAGEDSLDGDHEALHEHLGAAKGIARECLAEARRSVWNLLPEVLERNPLDVIISDEVDRFATTADPDADFTLLGARKELNAATQAAILRICQESLTNIRKYADANKVHVTLDFGLDAVTLTVKDDGVGFDPESIRIGGAQGGFGLTGMRQRARLLRGDVDIISSPGNGTVVAAKIPIS